MEQPRESRVPRAAKEKGTLTLVSEIDFRVWPPELSGDTLVLS